MEMLSFDKNKQDYKKNGLQRKKFFEKLRCVLSMRLIKEESSRIVSVRILRAQLREGHELIQ